MNLDELIKIIKKSFPKEDVELSKEIEDKRSKIIKLSTELCELEKKCNHPKKYIKVKNDGYYSSDGYGGNDWTGDGYRASCSLCGNYNVGVLKPDKGHKIATGTPVIVKNYKIAIDKEKKKRIIAQNEYNKKIELEQLKLLQEKYGTNII